MATIDNAVSRMAKKYGDSFQKFGKPQIVPAISTGSLCLNQAIGEPSGIPEGAIVEIYGWQHSGKTLMSYLTIIEAQKKYPERPCLIIDAERQFKYQARWAESLGVNVEELMVTECVTGEEAFDKLVAAVLGECEYDKDGNVVKVLKKGDFSVIVVDSVTQLIPASEKDADMDDSIRMAAQAGMIGKGLRKLLSAMTQAKSDTIIIFINQVRTAPSLNPKAKAESRSGGKALPFYATLIWKVTKVFDSEVRDGGKLISHDVQVKFGKNKAGSLPVDPVQFTLKYDGTGIDNEKELFEVAKYNGVIDQSGAYYQFVNQKTGKPDENVKKFYRKDWLEVLEQNPMKRKLIMDLIKKGKVFVEEMTTEAYEKAYQQSGVKVEPKPNQTKKAKKDEISSI